MNPDEVVALGAAVQAGVISGEVKGIVLLDVTSLSLGVETHDGVSAIIIPRNTTIPTEAMRTFTTATEGQTSVEVHVVQGEADRARLNDSLGRFDLDGLRPAPAGTPQIDVTFAIDLNGMVKASARDRATGRSQTVSVSARTGVAQEPALGVPKASEAAARTAQQEGDAAKAADAPQRAPQDTGLPTPAEATLQEAERLLGQAGDKIAATERTTIEKNLHELRSLVGENAAPEVVERSRSRLRQLATHAKESLLQRRAR